MKEVLRLLVELPFSLEAQVELGLLTHRIGQLEGAATAFRRAVFLAPQAPEPHFNLALTLAELGRLDEAASEYFLALAARDDYPEAWNNLGNLLAAQGKFGHAAAAFRQVLDRRPEHVDAWNNLGLVLQDLGLVEAALGAFRGAAVCCPEFAASYHNLGTLLKDLGNLSGALTAHRRAIRADPGLVMAKAALFHVRQLACDWSGLEAEEEQVLSAVRQGGRVSPMILLSMQSSLSDQLLCARNWAQPLEAASREGQYKLWPRLGRTPSDGPLRIGYLSADFHTHATAYLAAEVFERHDRSCFEVRGYTWGPDDDSPMRRRLVAAFDHLTDLRQMAHDAAAARIFEDGVDILVDLKGYTQHSRPEIAALRPAPVQVAWLGFPATMGAGFIDWVIADPIVAPASEQSVWTEKILALPNCYQPNDSQRQIGPTPTRRECGLPENAFVFCAFNSSYKLNPAFFDVWMRLLAVIPESVLWLLDGPAPMPQNLRKEASARGIDPDRLVFAAKLPQEQHLARHRQADLFLDVLPYGAHTTASDALWAGLPLLTIHGSTFPGRVAASLLTGLDLPELVAPSIEAYEELAIKLAQQPETLLALRQRLEISRLQSSVFDGAGFARNLETAYRRIWDIRSRDFALSTRA